MLADEINRATPKTQSALLEAWRSARSRSTGRRTRSGTPFMVIATQNPIEHEGTYPLPEAQLDRFMMRLSIGYPSPEVEADILASHTGAPPLTEIGPVTDAPGVADMIEQAREVHVAARDPPLHRRPRRGHAPALGRVPRRQPARVDHDPARRARHGGRPRSATT